MKSDFMQLLYLNYKLLLEKETLKFSEENEAKLIEKKRIRLRNGIRSKRGDNKKIGTIYSNCRN
jgi:hypothetical protein